MQQRIFPIQGLQAIVAIASMVMMSACGGQPTQTPALTALAQSPTAPSETIRQPTASVTRIATVGDTIAPVATTATNRAAPSATGVAATATTAPPPTIQGALSSTTPGNADNQEDMSGDAPPPDIKTLPLLNGVPKIPLFNTSTATAQPPLPPLKENYGANDQPRIGIQIGHYQIDQLPEELSRLRTQTGGSGGGLQEVEVNLNIARRVATILTAKGATVDILPATVPIAYTADAFVAIHADAATAGNPHGFKLSPSRFSAIPQTDAALTNAVTESYARATGMPQDGSITRNMTGYYAFNSRRRQYSISRITPGIIIETGFLTNATDRTILTVHVDAVADGIATGIWQFIQNRPPLAAREKPQATTRTLVAALADTPIYDSTNKTIIAYVTKGQRFEYYEERNQTASIFVPVLRKAGVVRIADTIPGTVPR